MNKLSIGSCQTRNPIRLFKRGSEYVAARVPIIRHGYWNLAPKYYKWKLQRPFNQYNAPIDPTKIVFVDPSQLNQMTGRLKPNIDRAAAIGCIKKGHWDKNPRTDTMFTGTYFEETILHTSFYEHFVNAREWTETKLYTKMCQDPNFQQKMNVHCEKDVLNRLRRYDQIYDKIKQSGYKTQYKLKQENGLKNDRVGYLDLLTDEITVDIGRDGSLLFVDGNHRLSIVKLLGLKLIPVVILVRHKKWINRRELLYEQFEHDEMVPTHPDTIEFVKQQ